MSEHLHRAHELIQAGDIPGAEAALAEAARVGCNEFHRLTLIGGMHMKLRRFGEALGFFGQASIIEPSIPTVHYNAGMCLYELGRFEEAADAYRRATFGDPGFAKAWMKLGGALLPLHRFSEALACQERAVGIDPSDAELYIALGTTISLFDDNAGAISRFEKAIELNPDAFEAEVALGHVLMRDGQWRAGWNRFEARFKLRPFGAPWDWKPTPGWYGKKHEMEGKSVLLTVEQGYGDTIQFCRYIPLVQKRAASVMVQAPRPLWGLLHSMGCQVVDVALGEFDIRASLMSLPGIFGTTTLNTPLPARFKVTARDVGAKVGVCWHGDARPHDPIANADDQRRSVPWEEFAPITEVLPCLSLQMEDLSQWGCSDWTDTAAIIAGLDLVITVDTAIAHLAGSLGIPTWLLARRGGCWRWLSTGTKTCWYPSMTIYRQEMLCEWRPTIARVVHDLKAWKLKHA